jgi:hypothetical protein
MPSRSEWATKLASWVKPASQAEQDKRDRTEREIGEALSAADLPAGMKTYAKGSYANNTNVRLDSDVDISVEFTHVFYYDIDSETLPAATGTALGITPATGRYAANDGPAQLKSDVEQALVAEFGRPAVTRGNKSIQVRETSRLLAADVVPCFSYKHYFRRTYGHALVYHDGTKLFPDRGAALINWLRQHLENGRAKNKPERTARRFKGMVRAVKHLENEMVDEGHPVVPSYLLECLVYNVPDDHFGRATLYDDFRAVLATIFNETRPGGNAEKWVEVNERKYLFHASQKWTLEEAFEFAGRAWAYGGFDG